ncbi:hypothetical protein ESA94_11805 [Lacibacter luteus]|uniref:Uncharacterized protein n=1 Tax=Lacibacter luteus TaxID=2508719 RepID=A0A4Q1CI64_9BACT|nr:hypothetical protein [Lacibacter luteus]RXK59739.1 hypothetical protein ESA94_11805 [Lacibacter luteus]
MYEVASNLSEMPRIRLFGITVLEPFTVLTNLFIAFACFYAYYSLKKRKLNQSFTHRYIVYFFVLIGWATIIGGVIGHAFLYATGLYGKIPGWYISMAGVAAFERAAIAHGRPFMHKKVGRFFSILNIVEICSFMLLSLFTLNFLFVELHATYGLFVVVFCFELYVYLKTKQASFQYLLAATVLGFAAALCHALKLNINRWFNYNDISHLFMTASIFCYYKMALKLKLYGNEKPPTG